MTGLGAADKRGGGSAGYAGWLSLAAAPTFAGMALLTGLAGGPMDRLCAPAGWAPINEMALMYLLMSLFHAPPWLRLIGRLRGGA
ncbi:MAG TPA: hypothetical protein VN694_00785 [Caulobacteraceae bacterium]|nr:hypothetical protein [Caulobacteraceae bacterium]